MCIKICNTIDIFQLLCTVGGKHTEKHRSVGWYRSDIQKLRLACHSVRACVLHAVGSTNLNLHLAFSHLLLRFQASTDPVIQRSLLQHTHNTMKYLAVNKKSINSVDLPFYWVTIAFFTMSSKYKPKFLLLQDLVPHIVHVPPVVLMNCFGDVDVNGQCF